MNLKTRKDMKRRENMAGALVKSLLEAGWMLRFPVSGRSMKPLLRDGSRVRVAPLSPSSSETPRLGDIVLFELASGRLVAHRVIEIQGQIVRTKGDSSGEAEAPVDRSQLLGTILGIEGRFFVPLDGPTARRIGLFLNRHYPRLVRLKAALRSRLGIAPPLTSEGP